MDTQKQDEKQEIQDLCKNCGQPASYGGAMPAMCANCGYLNWLLWCDHVCSEDCVALGGCNCTCGQWHDEKFSRS